MRSIYRPDLFLSISTETWTIMSFKYNTVHYKQVTQIRTKCLEICTLIEIHMICRFRLIFTTTVEWPYRKFEEHLVIS